MFPALYQRAWALLSVLTQSWAALECIIQRRTRPAQEMGAGATRSEWGRRVWGDQPGLQLGGTGDLRNIPPQHADVLRGDLRNPRRAKGTRAPTP